MEVISSMLFVHVCPGMEADDRCAERMLQLGKQWKVRASVDQIVEFAASKLIQAVHTQKKESSHDIAISS